MPRLGYLLPTRERVMEGQDDTGSLLALAERAEKLGYDSLWVGDSLLARPRHDPLTLLAAVAARASRSWAPRCCCRRCAAVVLAQQVATLDRIAEGRLILGIGIAAANIRAEFVAAGVPFEEARRAHGRGIALAKALWFGKPVTWDGLEDDEQRAGPHVAGSRPWLPAPSAPVSAVGILRRLVPQQVGPHEYAAEWAEVEAASRRPLPAHLTRRLCDPGSTMTAARARIAYLERLRGG